MELFHEDILETFLFFFTAAMGVIQVMAARRGWHGLCLYGGRIRRGVNYVLGTSLLLFSYAWYFSDPLHRNVRNIEALMSMVCLFLGCLAAAAATALVASVSEAVRRRLRRRPREGERERDPRALRLEGVTVLVAEGWGRKGDNLVAVGEPGRDGERVARRIISLIPPDRGVMCVLPARSTLSSLLEEATPTGSLADLLAECGRRAGVDPQGEVFLGLGWGANLLASRGEELVDAFRPARLLLLAPVMPDAEKGLLGDAFLSQTPADILECLLQEEPWRDRRLRSLARAWFPLFLLCAVPATAATVALHLRWSLLSGPLLGLVVSLWMAYYAARRRGLLASQASGEPETASALWRRLSGPSSLPRRVAVASDDAEALLALYAPAWSGQGETSFELWNAVLRGKLFLGRDAEERLRGFLAPGDTAPRDV